MNLKNLFKALFAFVACIVLFVACEPKNTGLTEEQKEESAVIKLPDYEDVKVTDWYYEYVKNLTKSGIVSGDGTGNFNPDANVTREQFLKMLLAAAGIDTNNAENVFADVLNDGWYKDYVLTAKKLGIVNGISDTEFGIGLNVTRQDMAVMIMRTLESINVDFVNNNAEIFADDNLISDYAVDSVYVMRAIGLISGYDNEFRPKDNLTRAEASKIIFGLMGLISGV